MKIKRKQLRQIISEAMSGGAIQRLKISVNNAYVAGKKKGGDPTSGFVPAITLVYKETGGKTPTEDQKRVRGILKDYLENETDYSSDKMTLASWGEEEDTGLSDDPKATARAVSPDKYLVKRERKPGVIHPGHKTVSGARSGDEEEGMFVVKTGGQVDPDTEIIPGDPSTGIRAPKKHYSWESILAYVIDGKKLLRKGDGGEEKKNSENRGDRQEWAQVKAIETLLKDAGHDPGKIDGNFDSGTKNAVKAFQRKLKLSVDGVVGRQTATAFNPSKAAQKIPITGALPGDIAEAAITRKQLKSLIIESIIKKLVKESVSNSINNWDNLDTENKVQNLYNVVVYLADEMDKMHGKKHNKPVVSKGASSERLSSKDDSVSDEEMMLKYGKKNENHT